MNYEYSSDLRGRITMKINFNVLKNYIYLIARIIEDTYILYIEDNKDL